MHAKHPLLRLLSVTVVILGLFTAMAANAGATGGSGSASSSLTRGAPVCDNGTEIEVDGAGLQAYLDANPGSTAGPCAPAADIAVDAGSAPAVDMVSTPASLPTQNAKGGDNGNDNNQGNDDDQGTDNGQGNENGQGNDDSQSNGGNTDNGYPNNGDNGNDAPGNPGHKVWVCHLADSSHYVLINIDWSGWDNGHSGHQGDVLLGDEPGDCPSMGTETPTPTPGKVWVCHWANHKYVLIHISQSGWDNGHSKHEKDYLVDEGERCEGGQAEYVSICHVYMWHYGHPFYELIEINKTDLDTHLGHGDVYPTDGKCPEVENPHKQIVICHLVSDHYGHHDDGYHHGYMHDSWNHDHHMWDGHGHYILLTIWDYELDMHLGHADYLPIDGKCEKEDHHEHHHHGGGTVVTNLPNTGTQVNTASNTALYLALSALAFAGLGSAFSMRRRTR